MLNLTVRTAILVVVVAAFAAATLLAMGCAAGESETARVYREYAECRDRAEPGFMDVQSRIAILDSIDADPADIAVALAKCLAKEGR